MNIFCLSNDPAQAAKWHVDKHMKMLLEFCQMACTNYHLQGISAPYRKTHFNHPSTVWLRESSENFQWGLELAWGLAKEYTERYGKAHKSQAVLKWCDDNKLKLSFDKESLTPFALAIKEDAECRKLPEFNLADPIGCYRLFYKHDKKHLHAWKQNKPDWI